MATNFQFDNNGNIIEIDLPIKISDDKRKTLLLYIWKIKTNRHFNLSFYSGIGNKIYKVSQNIREKKKRQLAL